MPPFVMDTLPSTGKAIRKIDPDGRAMRRMEREFEREMVKALNALRLATVRDVGDDANELVRRLRDEQVTRPFQDAIVRVLQRVALAGSEFGREQVGKYVFGTAKALEVGMWEFYSEERARQLAVTEVTRAFAEGNMAAWRAAGVIEKRRWNTNNDELVCPVCGPLAGQVRGLDDEFGDGIPLPPAHPRCRCWITPVVD